MSSSLGVWASREPLKTLKVRKSSVDSVTGRCNVLVDTSGLHQPLAVRHLFRPPAPNPRSS
jgi:hypothetical protein